MQRRTFLGILGGVAVSPLAARAQKAMPVIGLLNSGTTEPRRDQLESLLRGLNEAGFVPGDNVSILKRGAEDHYDRLPTRNFSARFHNFLRTECCRCNWLPNSSPRKLLARNLAKALRWPN